MKKIKNIVLALIFVLLLFLCLVIEYPNSTKREISTNEKTRTSVYGNGEIFPLVNLTIKYVLVWKGGFKPP